MPHVRFTRPGDLAELWKNPPRFSYTISQKDISFKYNNCYLSEDETTLLFKFVVAEGRLVQHIYLSLRLEDSCALLKIARNYPLLRTEGVKLLIAVVAAILEERGFSVISSSIGHYMKEGKFYQKHLSEEEE